MVLRLIGTIVGLVVIAFFVGFNLDNRCDVSVIFHTFKAAPVFITILISFIAGALFTMPFAFLFRARRKKERGGRAVPAEAVKKQRHPFRVRKAPEGSGTDGTDVAKGAASARQADPAQDGVPADGAQKDGASAAEQDA